MIYKKALAVSGGKDSMAMAHMFKNDPGIVALTIDHGLRAKSREESLLVQKWLSDLGIPHIILTWQHDGITTDIQSKARTARYDLMTTWCLENNVTTLVTAHHREDQLETFFMRLSKGSGLKGLCAMRESTHYNGIEILRPFLKIPKQKLHSHIPDDNFIDDPSNRNPKFARTHFRNLVEQYLLLDPEALILKSIDKLAQTDQYLDSITNEQLTHDLRSLHYVIFERAINKMFAGDGYPYKSQKIQMLYNTLRQPNFKATTFAHHLFKREKEKLEITLNRR